MVGGVAVVGCYSTSVSRAVPDQRPIRRRNRGLSLRRRRRRVLARSPTDQDLHVLTAVTAGTVDLGAMRLPYDRAFQITVRTPLGLPCSVEFHRLRSLVYSINSTSMLGFRGQLLVAFGEAWSVDDVDRGTGSSDGCGFGDRTGDRTTSTIVGNRATWVELGSGTWVEVSGKLARTNAIMLTGRGSSETWVESVGRIARVTALRVTGREAIALVYDQWSTRTLPGTAVRTDRRPYRNWPPHRGH